MLDKFICLATAAGTIGKVTSAALYPNGMIAIDVVEEDGTAYSLTYHAVAQMENQNADS